MEYVGTSYNGGWKDGRYTLKISKFLLLKRFSKFVIKFLINKKKDLMVKVYIISRRELNMMVN